MGQMRVIIEIHSRLWQRGRLFGLVLCLSRRLGLPLHVVRRIRAATLQRYYVIDHVALTWPRCFSGRRARVDLFKVVPCRTPPLYPAPGIARARSAFRPAVARVDFRGRAA